MHTHSGYCDLNVACLQQSSGWGLVLSTEVVGFFKGCGPVKGDGVTVSCGVSWRDWYRFLSVLCLREGSHEEQAWPFPSLSCFLAAFSHFRFHLSAYINECKKWKTKLSPLQDVSQCPLLILLDMGNRYHMTGAQGRAAASAHPAGHLNAKAVSSQALQGSAFYVLIPDC